jgi:peptidoglycan-associated lipoprotein
MRGKSFAFGMIASVMLMFGCGPKYPNCATDEHCQEQNEVCVNTLCKQCRDDSQCNSADPCGACGATNTCGKAPGCCTSDLDCPGGRCWNTPGQNRGECGPQCKDGQGCPAGQRCNAQNQCEPDWQCGAGTPCPAGKRCDENNKCVIACTTSPVYYDFNESRIRVDQQSTLGSNAECVNQMGKTVRIEGHCDERGTEEYNMALGERRANSSKGYLLNLGVASSSMRTVSYGEERPGCSESDESCWSQNRRTEFVFE